MQRFFDLIQRAGEEIGIMSLEACSLIASSPLHRVCLSVCLSVCLCKYFYMPQHMSKATTCRQLAHLIAAPRLAAHLLLDSASDSPFHFPVRPHTCFPLPKPFQFDVPLPYRSGQDSLTFFLLLFLLLPSSPNASHFFAGLS